MPQPASQNDLDLDFGDLKTPEAPVAKKNSGINRKLQVALMGVGFLAGYAYISSRSYNERIIELAQDPDLTRTFRSENLERAVSNAVILAPNVFLVCSREPRDEVIAEFEKQHPDLRVQRFEGSDLAIDMDANTPLLMKNSSIKLHVASRE